MASRGDSRRRGIGPSAPRTVKLGTTGASNSTVNGTSPAMPVALNCEIGTVATCSSIVPAVTGTQVHRVLHDVPDGRRHGDVTAGSQSAERCRRRCGSR
jgi:hypothetical protein